MTVRRVDRVCATPRVRVHATALVLVILMGEAIRRAEAACGQAFCPIETAAIAERPTKSRELTLDVSWEYIDQDQPRVDTHTARVGEVPSPEHNEVETVNRTYKVVGEYGITDRIAVGALIPVVHRDHRHVVIDDGETESWDFSGLGDVQLWSRYSLLRPAGPGDRALSLGLGVKLPTGRTNMRNSEDEIAEITLQPGTGSADVLASVIASEPFNVPAPGDRRVWAPIFASALARATGTDGKFDYRAGTEVLLNLGAAYPVFERLHVLGQVNFRYRDRDDAGNADGVPEGNTGGEFLFLSPGLRFRMVEALWAYGMVQIPVYQRVNGIQLTSDWNLLLGATYRFSIAAPDDQ